MLKRIRISVTKPVLLPSNLKHTGTIFKVSKALEFREEDLLVNELVTDNPYDMLFTLDILKDDTVYVVTQYQYTVIDENGDDVVDGDGNPVIKMGTPSRVSSLKSDQEGVKISDTIVRTPELTFDISYDSNINGNIKVVGNEFDMYSSTGKHLYTNWIVKGTDGSILFKREEDRDNLTSIVLPDEITLDTNFIVYASYYSDTNAESNYTIKENIKTNEIPLFRIKPYNKLIVGRYLYFFVEILNKRFKNIDVTVKGYGEVFSFNNFTKTILRIPTEEFKSKNIYDFEFSVLSENDILTTYTHSMYAYDYADRYDINKKYLDKYDYNGLLFTNGETYNLSYQLSSGKILLAKSLTKVIHNAKYSGSNIVFLEEGLDLNLDTNIVGPEVYVNELLNGDVIISYKSKDVDELNNIFINVYTLDLMTDELILMHTTKIDSKINIVSPGSITVSGNSVYYIDYSTETRTLVKLNPYTSSKQYIDLPYQALYSYSLVTTKNNDIILLGGTNDDLHNFDLKHQRLNDKAYILDLETMIFTELGNNILSNITKEVYQFHLVYRHDDKITMFNNINNINYDMIADQSTYILDFNNLNVTLTYNDHADGLPYGNTVVLLNGDVLRYTNLVQDPQKLYNYVADSAALSQIDDDNSLVYNPSVLVVKNGEVITVNEPCKFDSITIQDGGTLILGDNPNVSYDSSTLVLTRDTVMTTYEFEQGNYSLVYKACSNIRFVIVN